MTHSYRVSTAARRGWKSLAWCLAAGLSLLTGAEALAQEQEEPGEDPKIYSETVLEEGEGYQLKLITGILVDDEKPESYSREFYTLTSLSALETLKLPIALQEDLKLAFEAAKAQEDKVFSIDKRIVDELRIAEEKGELTPYLKEISEPLDEGEVQGMGPFGSCSDQIHSRSKSFSINTPINTSTNFGGGFSGSFYTTGNMSGSATGEVVIKVKRSKVFWVCIPYAIRFGHARAWGNASVSNDSSINGSLSYAFNWQQQIAKPHLGSLNFAIGPLPVHIGFNLPIELGVSINATVTGTIAYNGQQTATGSFDYTCNSSNCSGYASYSLGSAPTPQPVTASVSGRIYPTLWAQVSVRAYLYSESIAYAQVGVRPYLYGDFWGYYGNTCGDANGDFINETVSALTFDLDWQLYITARTSVLGSTNNWNLWNTSRRHIRFWDLLSGGSSAIRPTLLGPSSTTVNTFTNYSSRMRPCWPYGDTVSSRFSWGDGTLSSYSAAPSTTTTRAKAWSTAGTLGVQSTALSDSHGRSLNASTLRKVQVN
ncbi:hypothetical protein ATI61_101771 [Archangium gephyra]|uniref:Uncharacterized protein n=1 Tax=Archangium gephyra TaxID=48 RepID=A0AAC8QBE3_9BACT|nr:hypothetical protein [Archangium gephyra]AKJ04133.1 Hypothetical protein AA314_05759 [Archangium gephyra]REG37784.1 hypothetical protein ATI61_101771 [Archangium gephyra]